MKAEELRIGSLVDINISADENEFFVNARVERITPLKIFAVEVGSDDGWEERIELFRPIPLSPSWLERAGFVWRGGDHWEDATGKIWIEDRAGLYRICKPFLGLYKMEFVHQFQNTIYINFNIELTFNL